MKTNVNKIGLDRCKNMSYVTNVSFEIQYSNFSLIQSDGGT